MIDQIKSSKATVIHGNDFDAVPISSKEEFEKLNIFGIGIPNNIAADHFTGQSYVNPMTSTKSPVFVCNVTCEPGCRCDWHEYASSDTGGQVLQCIAGLGWVQVEGEEPIRFTPGTTVTIGPNIKYWQGAAANSWCAFAAVQIPGSDVKAVWYGKVTDKEYPAE